MLIVFHIQVVIFLLLCLTEYLFCIKDILPTMLGDSRLYSNFFCIRQFPCLELSCDAGLLSWPVVQMALRCSEALPCHLGFPHAPGVLTGPCSFTSVWGRCCPTPGSLGGGRELPSHADEECFPGRPRPCRLTVFMVGASLCGVSGWGWEVPGPAGKETVSQTRVPCGMIPLAGASSILFSVFFFSFNLAKFLFSCTFHITKISHWIWVLTWAV